MFRKLRTLLCVAPLLSAPFAAHCDDSSSSSSSSSHSSSSSSSSSCSSSSSSSSQSEESPCSWGLDPTFNPCSDTPGYAVAPTSPFLDLAQSLAIENCKNDCTKQTYYVTGDSVNLPNYCSGQVDGHVDERVTAVQAFNFDGTRDVTFGQNGVLRFANSIFGNVGSSILVKCNDNSCQNLFVVGNTQTAPSGEFDTGVIGNCDPQATCGFSLSRGPDNTPQYYATNVYLAAFKCNGDEAVINEGDCYEDVNGNAVSFLTVNPNDPDHPHSNLGTVSNKITWLDSHKNHIISVGYQSPNLSGCLPADPEVLKVAVNDGCVEFDVTTPISNFVDCNDTTAELAFGQYNAVATHTTNGTTSIYAVGDADVSTETTGWPLTARGILAKYNDAGALDQDFGTITLSKEGKQVLLRSIVTDGDFLYLGGDIADAGSGAPGQFTQATAAETGELIARVTANFLIVKLNIDGTPVSIDPTNNHNTVALTYNRLGTNPICLEFNAIQTDFFGGDDACFALALDGQKLVAAGFASFGPTIEDQKPVVVRYKISNALNLDTAFNNVGYVYLKDISPFRALARDLAVTDENGCHKRYVIAGQAASGPASTATQFSDATTTDMFIAALSREGN